MDSYHKDEFSQFTARSSSFPFAQNDVKFMDAFVQRNNTHERQQHDSSTAISWPQSVSSVNTDTSYDQNSDPAGRQNHFSHVHRSGQMASGSGSDCSSGFQFNQRREEGYDYDFVLPREDKYDCPICLLVLRDPYQTECGHRFCQNCIKRWLRETEAEPRCPVDNAPLGEGQIFPDNFAKREILALLVKCPNHKEGCDTQVVLKQLQKHLEICEFACVPCPNRCSHILLRKDLNNHLEDVCHLRTVKCPTCHTELQAEYLQNHVDICPLANVECQFCGNDGLIREQLQRHLSNDCPKAVIDCDFRELGCKETVERQAMAKHMQHCQQDHMQQMCTTIVSLVRLLQLKPNLNDTSGQTSNQGGQGEEGENSLNVLSGLLQTSMALGPQLGPQPPQRPHRLRQQFSTDNMLSHASSDSSTSRSGEAIGRRDDDRAISARTQAMSTVSMTSNHIPGVDLEGAPRLPFHQDFEFQSLKCQNATQDESLARHEQSLVEIQQKNDTLERTNRDLRSKVKALESTLADIEGRTCNGTYLWKIKNYSKFRREAEHGDTTAIHSPPFYSSFYGYKLCIRVNLNGVDSARGTHLSVFIHFMQGEYDDILEWPFSGRIVLTVLDQNPICEQRHHVIETLVSKPHLAAFQKPVTPRNHKGFGYMEFLPLGILDNSNYIKNDTLLIRAFIVNSST
ncbi:TNF receptor-associated factor 6-like isoform X1 [Argopecten irradians]|uniref:TNF receptor-associated factor 6-like isoform X1 n=2 Tax=Argopecten irradians TaxID=31199 RepID=UPI0037140F63